MDLFAKHKEDFLSKIDKSKKGSIDKPIRSLVDSINKLENYYTTSSCSGRSVLIHRAKGNKKNNATWLLSSHAKITPAKLIKALEILPTDGEIWFLSEAPILHIACATIEGALSFMRASNECGFKRSAIIGHKEGKTMVELIGTNRIEMPIAIKGELLIERDALSFLAANANLKMKDSHERLKRLEQSLKILLDH